METSENVESNTNLSNKRKVENTSNSVLINPNFNAQGNSNGHSSPENIKKQRIEDAKSQQTAKAFDDNEFIFESLERITDELAVVKQYLQELPQKMILNMSCVIKAEVDLQ